jgi:hypothetical protein
MEERRGDSLSKLSFEVFLLEIYGKGLPERRNLRSAWDDLTRLDI